ncbi:unnamed protein product [Cyprideis torosa]|uniref:Phosphomevalonate kinase n=1 Tax=Cyprideis torosa TaxID=163714 RepID=A0A7R8W0U5_9CRUS|nr:unnamed protein product [Cyprideis torosa]CAG0879129.1 unnamed protein product [Cyprideis torosa]
MDIHPPPLIITLSGKRKCGKDFISDIIMNSSFGDHGAKLTLSAPIKEHWAATKGLSYEELCTSSEYKENHRKEMVAWGEEQRRKDPAVFIRAVAKAAPTKVKFWLVSDVRRWSDMEVFDTLQGTAVKRIKVTASPDTRKRRNFVFTPGVDDAGTECDLDPYEKWDLVIHNDGTEENLHQQLEPTLSEIIEHDEWCKEHNVRLEAKRKAIERWKEDRKMEKLQERRAASLDELRRSSVPGSSVSGTSSYNRRNEHLQRQLEEYRLQKADMEAAAAAREAEEARAQAIRRRNANREIAKTRCQMRLQWQLMKKHQEQKKREKQAAAEAANALRMKNFESRKNASRLFAPTQAHLRRIAAAKPASTLPSSPVMSVRTLDRKGVPAWRQVRSSSIS